MQPIEEDTYAMIRTFRFSPGMDGWYTCFDAKFSEEYVRTKDGVIMEVKGAQALLAGASALILAALY